MVLELFVLITALAIASVAAFFSIVGIAITLSGVYTAALIMGAVLELGKVVAVSFTYRNWETLGFKLRALLVFFILSLMAITSMGVYGYLTNGYVGATYDLRLNQQKIHSIDKQIEDLNNDIELLRKDKAEIRKNLDNQLANMPKNFVTKREQVTDKAMELIANKDRLIDQINQKIYQLSEKKHELELAELETKSHIGPIVYIADFFGYTIDQAIKWFVLIIVIVFDPFAVTLMISYNHLVMKRLKNEQQLTDEKQNEKTNTTDNDDDRSDDNQEILLITEPEETEISLGDGQLLFGNEENRDVNKEREKRTEEKVDLEKDYDEKKVSEQKVTELSKEELKKQSNIVINKLSNREKITLRDIEIFKQYVEYLKSLEHLTEDQKQELKQIKSILRQIKQRQFLTR